MKKLTALIAALVLSLAMCVTAFAEDTTDYTFTESEVIDFCVFNTWGTKSVECMYAQINNIELTVEVSGYSGDPIDVKLYNRESVTWGTWTSEAQTISGDGTYTFKVVPGEAYPVENLCTIYLKDVKCEASDVDPEGLGESASNVTAHIVMKECKFNVVEEEPTDAPTDAQATHPATTPTTVAGNNAEEGGNDFPIGLVVGIAAGLVVIIVVIVVVLKKKK